MKKQLIVIIIFFSLYVYGDQMGELPKAPLPKLNQATPLVKSKFYITEADVINGEADLIIPLDTPHNAFALIVGEDSVDVKIDGRGIAPKKSYRDKTLKGYAPLNQGTRIDLDSYGSGNRNLKLTNLKLNKQVKMIVAQPQSALQFEFTAKPLVAKVGEEIALYGRIKDLRTPARGAVEVKLDNGKIVKLLDNGKGADAVAGDGLYSARVTAPYVNSFQPLRLQARATGIRYNNTDFQRDAATTLMISNSRVKLDKNRVAGKQDSIEIPMDYAAGKFRIYIIFGAQANTLGFSSKDFNLDGSLDTVSVQKPPIADYADKAIIRVLNLETMGLEDEIAIDLIPIKTGLPAAKRTEQTLPPAKVKSAQQFGG